MLNQRKATSPFFKDMLSIDKQINLVKYASDTAKFKELVLKERQVKLNKQNPSYNFNRNSRMGRSSSLVGHLLDVQKVVGPNPARPTIDSNPLRKIQLVLKGRAPNI